MEKSEQNDKWNFLKGFDVSSLPEHEDCGGKFFDADGNEKEAFEFPGSSVNRMHGKHFPLKNLYRQFMIIPKKY